MTTPTINDITAYVYSNKTTGMLYTIPRAHILLHEVMLTDCYAHQAAKVNDHANGGQSLSIHVSR